MKTLALTLSSLTLSLTAHATVVQIQSYAEVAPITGPDTLVVFDLDNTIIEPTQMLGSDQWGSKMQQRLRDQGLPSEAAVDQGVNSFFVPVQLVTPVKLVETLVHEFLGQLQSQHIPVMALTARPLSLVARTLDQLQSVDVDFTRSPVSPTELNFGSGAQAATYRNGVLFVGPHNNKGQLLKDFFVQIGRPLPQKIIFFDDKQHHVDDMEVALAHENTSYTGYRYGAADATVAALDLTVADLQWRVFQQSGRILSDAEARAALNLN